MWTFSFKAALRIEGLFGECSHRPKEALISLRFGDNFWPKAAHTFASIARPAFMRCVWTQMPESMP